MIPNAHTDVAVSKSIGEVFDILARMGAASILVRYDDHQVPSGVGFDLAGPNGMRSFELPLQIDGVLTALIKDQAPPKFRTRAHSAKVAWRIAKDWLRAQLGLIEAQMASTDEVFLPYLLPDGRGGDDQRTLYTRYIEREKQLALEAAASDEEMT